MTKTSTVSTNSSDLFENGITPCFSIPPRLTSKPNNNNNTQFNFQCLLYLVDENKREKAIVFFVEKL